MQFILTNQIKSGVKLPNRKQANVMIPNPDLLQIGDGTADCCLKPKKEADFLSKLLQFNTLISGGLGSTVLPEPFALWLPY